jgi:nitrogen fixation/metabolism regulation signal transduction histidine kinase
MAFRGFRTNVTLRVILLTATAAAGAWALSIDRYATALILALLVLVQAFSLVRYVEFTNRSLELFLRSIEVADFSHRLSPGPAGKTFANLGERLERAFESFRRISSARQESLNYLQSIVQHVPIGVLAFEEDGRVVSMNPAAKSLLDVPALETIDDLAAPCPELYESLRGLKPGRRDLVTVADDGRLMQLSLQATGLRRREQTITIVSIQNISAELNEKEMDAWRNLIRVLTHEIKNSLTPIASLAASVERSLADGEAGVPDRQTRDALQVIQKRSDGLLEFVDAYRDLTHIPEPECKTVKAGDLFARVEQLIAPQVVGKEVRLRSSVRPEGLELIADPRLIEQVLINLVLNAVQAGAETQSAKIDLEAWIDEGGRPLLRVTDNGPGIAAEALERIFVPFYSTRKDGSGIGLSLSRQIMRKHRGDLTVRSRPGVETSFTLRF